MSFLLSPKILPNSSTRTKECIVACCRMEEVSLNSTKNVLSPTKKGKPHLNTCFPDCVDKEEVLTLYQMTKFYVNPNSKHLQTTI